MKNANWRVKNLPKNNKGSSNGRWKGGIHYRKDGYILIRIPNRDKNSTGKGYELKHRLVMAKHLKRPLLRSEIVHHINGNKSDNRIKNLKVMTQSEHAKQDYLLRTKNKLGQLCSVDNHPLDLN
jgi:uncharacterized protein (DUF1330 family)